MVVLIFRVPPAPLHPAPYFFLIPPLQVTIMVDDNKIFLHFVTAVTVETVCTMFSIPALS